jgi:malate dehydrogenase (oxaloacetate-decarboxylating)(NADP+)
MAHGRDILLNARLNKGTAFTEHEREALGLMGLLPDGVSAPADQLLRVKRQMQQCTTDLDKYVYLSELADHNERLFFTMLRSDPAGLMPLVYTPTVGEACQKFGHIMRRPRGLYVGLNRKGRIRQVLENWPEDDVRFIVVTDGERILGLGDQGVCGMGIPIGKLALYSAFGGVPPEAALPVTLDVGTNNEAFLEDPLYPGLRQRRITGPEYDAFVEEFVMAVQQVFPRCCIQFEDFTNKTAIPLLQRYRDRVCCFNDDIQGTAAVAVAGMLGACRIRGDRLRDHRIVFYGAGSAAIGIADLCCLQMTREGLSMAEARTRCFLMNSKGLVTADSPGLSEHQQPYAHANPSMRDRGREHRGGRVHAGGDPGDGAPERAAGHLSLLEPHLEERVHCEGGHRALRGPRHLRQWQSVPAAASRGQAVRAWAGQQCLHLSRGGSGGVRDAGQPRDRRHVPARRGKSGRAGDRRGSARGADLSAGGRDPRDAGEGRP